MKTLGMTSTAETAVTNEYNDVTMSRFDGIGMSMVNAEMRGAANGYAPLNSEAKVANRYLPDIITSDVASITESDIDRMIYGGLGE